METGTVKAEESTHAGEHSYALGSEAVRRAANEVDVELSIVMPCLNEAETLGRCIEKAKRFLKDHQVVGEILIGDNGSTDGSQALAEGLGARVVPVKTRGYGAAVFYASIEARGRYILMGDSDDSYDFTAIAPFLRELRAGCDLVMGNRFKGGIRPGAMPWKNRYFGNPLLSAIGRLFFGCPAGDFYCGMRGFSAEAFRRMDLRTTGMEFALEMVIRTTLAGMRTTEVPTTLDPDGRSRPPHLRPWRDGWRGLRFMLLFSPRWLFLIPGLLMMICGTGLAAFLWPGDRGVFGVHIGVHTMLYAAVMAAMGYQAVIFSVFAKVFAISEGLLPEDQALIRLFKYVTLESGLTLGLLLVVAGVAGTISAFHHWSMLSFGPLQSDLTLRPVIVAAFSLMLGTQTILSSFFLSVLGLSVRRS